MATLELPASARLLPAWGPQRPAQCRPRQGLGFPWRKACGRGPRPGPATGSGWWSHARQGRPGTGPRAHPVRASGARAARTRISALTRPHPSIGRGGSAPPEMARQPDPGREPPRPHRLGTPASRAGPTLVYGMTRASGFACGTGPNKAPLHLHTAVGTLPRPGQKSGSQPPTSTRPNARRNQK